MHESVVLDGNSAIISFTDTNLGLQIRDEGMLNGFVFEGADKQFLLASAVINTGGESIRVWSDSILNLAAVKYCWENFPIEANLTNNSDLLASPFRTDD